MQRKNNNTYHKLPILDGLEMLHAKSHKVSFPFHTHDTFSIALILDATFSVKLNDKLLKAPIGTLSITNPEEVHATPCDKNIGNSFFTFYISPDAVTTLNGGESVFFEERTIYDSPLFQEFYFLSLNFHNKELNFEHKLVETIKKLVRRYAAKPTFSNQSIKLFQSFIQETNLDHFSLPKTAKKFGLDKYKFLRLFKQETGLTPNNFLLLKRIEKSKQLLKAGNAILDVAFDSGFYDLPHFYRNFKRFTGVTPLNYCNIVQ